MNRKLCLRPQNIRDGGPADRLKGILPEYALRDRNGIDLQDAAPHQAVYQGKCRPQMKRLAA